MFSAHCLMMVYICPKFHENIFNGIRITEQTRKVNGRTYGHTEGRTVGGHCSPFNGRIKRHLVTRDVLDFCDERRDLTKMWYEEEGVKKIQKI